MKEKKCSSIDWNCGLSQNKVGSLRKTKENNYICKSCLIKVKK
jgi:hypothetical protein